MRFDDLILPVGEYPAGACENRQEWLLMYSRGVPVGGIAAWCRVDVRRVHGAIDKQAGLHPEWFDRCWRIHDQPAPAKNTHRYVKTREQAWREHYDDVAAYMRERRGVLPAQNDSPEARVLYRWIEAQRRQHDAGTLAQDRIDALDRLGEWIGTRKGDPEELWAQRVEEVQAFRADAGRYPYYDPDRHPDEKVLAVWLGRQCTWWRKGRLRADRQERLDHVLPGWDAFIVFRAASNDNVSHRGDNDRGSSALAVSVVRRRSVSVPLHDGRAQLRRRSGRIPDHHLPRGTSRPAGGSPEDALDRLG